MATQQDVAKASGYSVMTVSRVLSGRGYVSPRARASVIKAADRLNYVPNGVARSLRQSRTGTVALVISDIENRFYAGIAKTAETVLANSGLRLFVASSDEDSTKERQLVNSVREMRAEALLITPTAHNGDMLRKLARHGLPIVQLDRSVDVSVCSSVLLENEAAGAEAIQYLASRGHRRIVFISGPRELTTGDERSRGALRVGDAAGSAVDLTIVEAISYMHSHSIQAVREALRLHPTAIVAGNNVVAEACMEVFAESQIDIPTEMSLITFDDMPWMRWIRAPLTSMRQPVELMTDAAVQLILKALVAEIPPAVEHLRFPATIVYRDSVRSV